ncbi:MAG: recombination mediator RecR, partial [Oscillospiraceae bacterium]|nr:recombination mediator RecR [Oscillospiraceae bacterium]
MTEHTPAPLLQAAEQFAKLPGIGMKTAQRLAYHILTLPVESAREFTQGIIAARESVQFCELCQNFTQASPCPLCAGGLSGKRNPRIICVVESPRDVSVFERSRGYDGVYHVLHGLISPTDGVLPDDIRIRELMERLAAGLQVEEVIMATNPTIVGEATAAYISRLVKTVGCGEIK